jgi:hypothetical protein
MITSPVASPTAVAATLPSEIRWSEPKLFGRDSQHALSVGTDPAGDGYPAVRATRHNMFDSPSASLEGTQVAAITDARLAVDTLRGTWDALAARELPATGDASIPARGMMTFGTGTGGYVSLPLKSNDAVISAFTSAVRDLADVVRANAPEI